MIKVDSIMLDIALPDSEIAIVVMQPFIVLCNNEPYRWKNDKKNLQIEQIIKTLDYAKRKDHGCEKTHFTIFPEYSIPGLEGISKIQESLQNSSWPGDTIVIGGIDGLTKDEYSCLCNENFTQVNENNKPDIVLDGKWVNCCVVWAKQDNGTLRKWIQPKLVPAWLEKNITCNDMFAGKAIYIFNGKFENGIDYNFLPLVCFDWIGQIGPNKGIEAVLFEIDRFWKNSGKKDIHFIFVLQNNDEPNHRDFLEGTRNYFEERSKYPSVGRDSCAVIFANTAGGSRPGRYQKYGHSSLVCSPNSPYDCESCPPTFSVRTKKIRNTDNLGRCKDALFREMGPCVHSFRFRIPSFINLGPSGRGLIIDRAVVYPVFGELDDPRVPSRQVPASIKWVNDELDNIKSILHHQYKHPLKNEIEEAHEDIVNRLRLSSDEFLRKCIEWASYNYEKWIDETRIHDIDNWNEKERLSLKTIVYSLSIIRLSKSIELGDSGVHAFIKIGSNVVDIIIVYGSESHDKGFEYGKQFLRSEQRFAIIITRDIHNFPLTKRDKSILEFKEEISDRGPDITNPNSRFIHCGYNDLKDSCFSSMNLDELKNKIKQVIGG